MYIHLQHTIASVPTTMWPIKKRKDGGDRLAAELKAAKCHKKLAVSTMYIQNLIQRKQLVKGIMIHIN